MGHVAKVAFHIYWESGDFGDIFLCLLMALGLILMTFGCLEDTLGVSWFLMAILRRPESEAPSNSMQVLMQDTSYNIKHAGITGYHKNRLAN